MDNAVTSVKNSQGQEITLGKSSFQTIDQVFATIEMALKGNNADVKISYHSAYGYPVNVSIDFDKSKADDEVRYQLIDFEQLQ